MKVEDNEMPINKLVRITTSLGVLGFIFLFFGILGENSEFKKFLRFLGAIQVFVSN